MNNRAALVIVVLLGIAVLAFVAVVIIDSIEGGMS